MRYHSFVALGPLLLPLLASAHLLDLPLVLADLVGLERRDVVDYALLALPPQLVQLVQQQLQLGLAQLSTSGFDELLAEVVDLLGYPKQSLGDEGLVAGAEMEVRLPRRRVKFCLDCLVDIREKSNPVVV